MNLIVRNNTECFDEIFVIEHLFFGVLSWEVIRTGNFQGFASHSHWTWSRIVEHCALPLKCVAKTPTFVITVDFFHLRKPQGYFYNVKSPFESITLLLDGTTPRLEFPRLSTIGREGFNHGIFPPYCCLRPNLWPRSRFCSSVMPSNLSPRFCIRGSLTILRASK